MKDQGFSAGQTYQWTAIVLNAIRHTLNKMSFQEILPTSLSQEMEPAAFHSVVILGNRTRPLIEQVEESYIKVTGKETYYLAVSQTFEKQQAVEYLDKVYCLAPCVRLLKLEEEDSGRHLSAFFQVEIEWSTESMDEVLQTAEKIMIQIANCIMEQVIAVKLPLSDLAKRNLQSIQKGQFSSMTFKEALTLAGVNSEQPRDFTLEESEYLCEQFDRPFWIYDYPEGIRDSIFHKNGNNVYSTFDLMLPFGYGELATGGIRAKSGESILEQAHRLDAAAEINAGRYMRWKNFKKIQTAGFGFGLERLMKFVSGAQTILDFIQPHDFGPNVKLKKTK